MALAALALVVFGANDSYPMFVECNVGLPLRGKYGGTLVGDDVLGERWV